MNNRIQLDLVRLTASAHLMSARRCTSIAQPTGLRTSVTPRYYDSTAYQRTSTILHKPARCENDTQQSIFLKVGFRGCLPWAVCYGGAARNRVHSNPSPQVYHEHNQQTAQPLPQCSPGKKIDGVHRNGAGGRKYSSLRPFYNRGWPLLWRLRRSKLCRHAGFALGSKNNYVLRPCGSIRPSHTVTPHVTPSPRQPIAAAGFAMPAIRHSRGLRPKVLITKAYPTPREEGVNQSSGTGCSRGQPSPHRSRLLKYQSNEKHISTCSAKRSISPSKPSLQGVYK